MGQGVSNILAFEGTMPKIDATAFVASTAVIIGDVEIGPGSGIWFHCLVRGDINYIRIGARTNIQDGTIMHVAGPHHSGGTPTIVGDDVTVGHQAILHACTLHDRSFVGMAATVMDGAVVESDAMVGAGALVPPGKRIPSGQLWTGSPARYRRDLTDAELAEIKASADRYVELARRYR
ncbi:MAG: gamma carbonic anhydrase family protein [Rhodospirillaceae bacterium]|nr:gamma carbonic anhydrase family protein [Rhodospirillaceae bacterium]